MLDQRATDILRGDIEGAKPQLVYIRVPDGWRYQAIIKNPVFPKPHRGPCRLAFCEAEPFSPSPSRLPLGNSTSEICCHTPPVCPLPDRVLADVHL